MNKNGIDQAIDAAGSQIKLAEMLGVSQQAVSRWKRRGWASTWHAVAIEAELGVPRSLIVRPELAELLDDNF